MLANSYRRRLFREALDQYGYVTTDDARRIGVPPVELRKLAARGGIEHIGRRVYRFTDFPRTDRDPYMEAVLLAGTGAHLAADSVLAFHHLALVNPKRIRVAVDRRARPRLPGHIEIIEQPVAPGDTTTYEGVPSSTVGRALRDCRGRVMGTRLLKALDEAVERGLVLRSQARSLRADLVA